MVEMVCLLVGHFAKDCFSQPGLQYSLVPEEEEEQTNETIQSVPQKQKKVEIHPFALPVISHIFALQLFLHLVLLSVQLDSNLSLIPCAFLGEKGQKGKEKESTEEGEVVF